MKKIKFDTDSLAERSQLPVQRMIAMHSTTTFQLS